MEQPFKRRRYMGKWGIPPFSPSRVRITIEGSVDYSLFQLGPFSVANLGTRFILRGEGCDTPSITITATVFYSISIV
jgi:hypothetical protein